MVLHSNFPELLYTILDSSVRWFPADESLRETSMDKLMPPLAKESEGMAKQRLCGGDRHKQ